MKFLVISVFIFMITACAPSEAEIAATVESRVEVAVAQTLAALPTQTPAATPTPMPTATPLPTSTSVPTPTADPISESFRSQLREFLKSGNIVTGASTQGVIFTDLQRFVGEARGAYDLAVAMWSKGIPTDAQADFMKAFAGWDLTLYLWKAQINELDEPVEPDINRYQEFTEYSDLLIMGTHPDDFIVPAYRGKEYVSFDNISLMMALSANHFEAGQNKVLSLLGDSDK